MFFSVTRCIMIARSRYLPLRFYFTCGLLRVMLGNLTGHQLQFLLPSTTETYRTWVRETRAMWNRGTINIAMEKITERIDTLPDGKSSLLWLGSPSTAEKVVLFLHGGGYKAPLRPGHLQWCLNAYMNAGNTAEIAVALLHYTLTPEATYPTQLLQASSALTHLLQSGFAPKDIIIGGDSAGGNLTAQLLSHLLRPHPKVEEVRIDEPLLGAFLVSPLLSARTDMSSFRDNDGIDMLSAQIVRLAVSDVLDGTDYEGEKLDGKGWAAPTDVDDSWFDGFSSICRNIYVTAGEQEVLRDQCTFFVERVSRRNPGLEVRLEIAENEAHDFILLEGENKIVGDATVRMRSWFNSILS